MTDVESYRRNAADCICLAAQQDTPDDKNILLNIALAWLRLGQQVQTIEPADSPSTAPELSENAAEPVELKPAQ
jgi:hypothetical protein